MLTENSLVYGLNGRSYRLGPELGSGGEGTVFALSGEPLVVKIYHKAEPGMEAKLRYMVMHPVPSLTDQYGNPILSLAWPKDIVSVPGQGFVGYVMPRVENALEIYHIVRGRASPMLKTRFPNYTWELNILTARNLALSVFHLHSSGYVIGDMNDKNILVRADGCICILDIDSFDFTDRSTGTHYKCCVGLADYLAPDLQARNLRSPGAVFSEATDDFALAIHIFQLLMDNYHPFTCRRLVQTQDSSSADQRVQQIVDGRCPYVRSIPGYDIPLSAPTLREMLPENLCQDFAQTLLYDASTAMAKASSRTTAEQWAQDLNAFLKACRAGDLVRCSANPEHYYLRSKGSCGLCAAERRYQSHQTRPVYQPAPPSVPVQPSRQTQAAPYSPPDPKKKWAVAMGWISLLICGFFYLKIISIIFIDFELFLTAGGQISFLVITWMLFLPVLRKQCLLLNGLESWQPKSKFWNALYGLWRVFEKMGILYPIMFTFMAPLFFILLEGSEQFIFLVLVPFGVFHILTWKLTWN